MQHFPPQIPHVYAYNWNLALRTAANSLSHGTTNKNVDPTPHNMKFFFPSCFHNVSFNVITARKIIVHLINFKNLNTLFVMNRNLNATEIYALGVRELH
jgi:hypothetical protein